MKKIEAYLECVRCHKHYDLSQVRYNCECGGILDLVRDLSQVDGGELKALWESRWGQKRGAASSGVWRYKELIFDLPDEQIVRRATPGFTMRARPASTPDSGTSSSSTKEKTRPAASRTAA